MSYQKCPACNGTGKQSIYDNTKQCNTCDGTGIINEITGLPPQKKQDVNKSTNFEDLNKLIQSEIL